MLFTSTQPLKWWLCRISVRVDSEWLQCSPSVPCCSKSGQSQTSADIHGKQPTFALHSRITVISAIDTCDCSAPPASVPFFVFSLHIVAFQALSVSFIRMALWCQGCMGLSFKTQSCRNHSAASILLSLLIHPFAPTTHRSSLSRNASTMSLCIRCSKAGLIAEPYANLRFCWYLYTFLLLPFLSFLIHALKKWCQVHKWRAHRCYTLESSLFQSFRHAWASLVQLCLP